jgi:crotonobetainyl-CoA:carnitine CoA-transferase CaiB-like acyl-CoA transferase
MFASSCTDIRVVDLGTNIAGPLAAMLLGDMGADVIKVERAPFGDDTRQLTPLHNGVSTVYLSVNRNKRSLLLDFKSPTALDKIRWLIAGADVVIDSFPPGVGAKLGLDFPTIAALNPRIVHCSISAFGSGEIGGRKPGYDALVQAFSGLMSFTGDPSGAPVRIAPSVLDVSTGMWALIGIMAALRSRANGAGAQQVSPSLIDSAFMLMCHQVAGFEATGQNPEKYGSGAPSAVPYRVYAASNGSFMLATASDPQFVRLCEAVSLPELALDSRFNSMAARIAHREELDQLLENVFEKKSVAHWLHLLEENNVAAGPVNTVSEAVESDLVRERALFLRPEAVGWSDGLPLVRAPLDLQGEGWFRPPPALGEHTDEILAELEKGSE